AREPDLFDPTGRAILRFTDLLTSRPGNNAPNRHWNRRNAPRQRMTRTPGEQVRPRLIYRRLGQRGPSSARAEPTPRPLHHPTAARQPRKRASSTPDMTTTQRAPSNGFEVKALSAWVLKPQT